jgi:hypothetical protein
VIKGQCRCGAVRYTIEVEALPPAYACHCHICQRYSGSAFSLQVMVPGAKLSVTGPVETFEIATEDRVSAQRFCEACHTRMYNTNTRRPGVAVVRAGTLERSEELECVAHIYTNYRQRWFVIPDGIPSWPEAAPMADFMALTWKPE